MSTPPTPSARTPNRLIHSTSPYLLQHARNPVDWWPWCPEALAEAVRSQRPILLSVGYSACHWCHVMEKESFEDENIAAVMNKDFICIKVDREERPDVDHLYQTVVQLMSGSGGWPLTAFLTPEAQPFFAGTYFPPQPRYGRPGFFQLLRRISQVWAEEREGVMENVAQLMAGLEKVNESSPGMEGALSSSLPGDAVRTMAGRFDHSRGGFGHHPKFPNATALELCLRQYLREGGGLGLGMAEKAGDGMAWGGIYDHLGGGFHRYSVDEKWMIPHFEKMLYDNALLPRVYLQLAQITENPLYLQVVRETLAYVKREMTQPEGGFFSSQDADSEGEEGLFFAWDGEEIGKVIQDTQDFQAFTAAYEVSSDGNFEGRNVLHRRREWNEIAHRLGWKEEELHASLSRSRRKLHEVREARIHPSRDDKVLTSWNGLMIGTFAKVAGFLNDSNLLEVARRGADFVLRELRLPDGRLLRSYRQGKAGIPGFLDDYAFLASALLDLYRADGDKGRLVEALALIQQVEERFTDGQGGYYLTDVAGETLIQRPRSLHDQSIPSGVGVHAENLVRLGAMTGDESLARRAETLLHHHQGDLVGHPFGASSLLLAADLFLEGPRVLVVTTPPEHPQGKALLATAAKVFAPDLEILRRTPDEDLAGHPAALVLEGKDARSGQPTAYLCQRFACSRPLHDVDSLAKALKSSGRKTAS